MKVLPTSVLGKSQVTLESSFAASDPDCPQKSISTLLRGEAAAEPKTLGWTIRLPFNRQRNDNRKRSLSLNEQRIAPPSPLI